MSDNIILYNSKGKAIGEWDKESGTGVINQNIIKTELNVIPTDDGLCPNCGVYIVDVDQSILTLPMFKGLNIKLMYSNYCPFCGAKIAKEFEMDDDDDSD